MGRPSLYTPEIAEAICRRLSEGESLRSICRDEWMPGEGTVRGWALDNTQGFSAQYTRARELGTHAIAETALEEALLSGDAALGRLAFDARRWFASKILPKHYGEKLQHTGDGGGDIAVRVTIADAGPEAPGEGSS